METDDLIDLLTQALIRAHGIFCEGKTLTEAETKTQRTIETAIETAQRYTFQQLFQLEKATTQRRIDNP